MFKSWKTENLVIPEYIYSGISQTNAPLMNNNISFLKIPLIQSLWMNYQSWIVHWIFPLCDQSVCVPAWNRIYHQWLKYRLLKLITSINNCPSNFNLAFVKYTVHVLVVKSECNWEEQETNTSYNQPIIFLSHSCGTPLPDNWSYSYSHGWIGTTLQSRLMQGISLKRYAFEKIPPHEPPLQASSSPTIVRLWISSIVKQ